MLKRTIGQRLDGADDFFHWLDRALISLAVLKLVIETDLCGQLIEGPKTLDDLASRCGLPAEKIRRIVNFLVAEEIVALSPAGLVAATPRTQRLRELGYHVLIQARTGEVGPYLRQACEKGVSAYEVRFGKPIFDHLPEDPVMAEAFAQRMAFHTEHVEEFVFSQHEFRPFECAVDVGGNHGGMLLGLLARHPNARGVLFDLPDTVARVAPAVRASAQGNRIEIVGGDFFAAVPAGDLYILKMILHDWPDAGCISILKNVRAAIRPGGRICVIDHVLPEMPAPTAAHIMDIAMMIWATGRERKLSELEPLLAAAGFRVDRVTTNPTGQSVVEAVPV